MASKKSDFAFNLAKTVEKSLSSTGLNAAGFTNDTSEGNYLSAIVSTQDIEPSDESIVSIPIKNLRESSVEREIYDISDEDDVLPGSAIDALARDIAKRGIQNPLRVLPASGHFYEIISGHRRFQALKIATERYGYCNNDRVPCIIGSKLGENRSFEAIEALILDNLQRDKSEYERMKEIVMFKRCTEKRKLAGEEIPNVREYVKEHLGISDSKITRYDKIYHSLIESLMEEFHKGNIAGSVAYKIATTDKKTQEYIDAQWNRKDAPILQLNIVTELLNQYITANLSNQGEESTADVNISEAPAEMHESATHTKSEPQTLTEGMEMLAEKYDRVHATLSKPFTADKKTKKRLLNKISKMMIQLTALENELATLGLLEDNDEG